jgi:hypothetical protein
MKQSMSYGWRSNKAADGFERDHGRFTMEVFWFETKRAWAWMVWASANVEGKTDQVIVTQGRRPRLDDAKQEVMREAASLEKEAIREDQKFR